MNICPKCKSYKIDGPRYVKGAVSLHDRLRYTCDTCGYYRDEPTADAPTHTKRLEAIASEGK